MRLVSTALFLPILVWTVTAPVVAVEPPALGFLLEREEARELLDAGTVHAASGSFHVRLVARWDEIEKEGGVYDWSGLSDVVTSLHERGFRVVLCLSGSNALYVRSGGPPSPSEGSSLPAWTAFARNAVQTLGPSLHAIEIWDGPVEAVFEPEAYAFVLKTTALAIRAEAARAGLSLRVAQGCTGPDGQAWQDRLWDADSSPYVDVVPLRISASGPIEETVSSAVSRSVEHPPASEIWVQVVREGDGGTMRAAVSALASSASVAFGALARDFETRQREALWAVNLHQILDNGFAAAPPGAIEIVDASGAELPGTVLGRFLSGEDLTTLIVYDVSGLAPDTAPRVVVDTALTRNSRLVDLETGDEVRLPSRATDNAIRRAFVVPVEPVPQALLFQLGAPIPGLDLPPEEVEIRRSRGLTAAEIIALHQQVQKVQDDRLDRWNGRGRVDLHFKLGQAGSTVDVAIESNYFWERGGDLEWEQTDYYFNGNRVRWKKIPELPLIQPEKVVTLPLDLTLDRTYTYFLAGEDKVDGRPAYVLGFEPAPEAVSKSLYSGRVWIDKETFVRLKLSVVQNNLESPVLTNEEVDRFEPVRGPDGTTYWMLTRGDGQQLWKTGGRSFVVRRELTFETIEINPSPEEFERAREVAYASSHQMLRDTDDGFRYLERQDDGSRLVKTEVDSDQLFLAVGAFSDSSRDNVVPLAGVNYFNYNLWNRDLQANVFFAGPLAFLNLTDPAVFGSRMDLAIESTINGLKSDQKIFDKTLAGNPELGRERLRTRSQNLSVRYGIPWGDFLKFTLIYDLDYVEFFYDDEIPPLPGFVLPQDHVVTTGEVQVEFNRRGYTLLGRGAFSGRSDWKPWGVDPFDPDTKTFSRWGATAFKEWYLPRFQKIRGEINYLDGSDLDRFSRYGFSLFGGNRLSGFAGSGLRFDSGVIARAGYSFNLLEVLRFDLTVESARVKELPFETEQHTGVGLSGNIVGPWRTVISASYGYALRSDIESIEGDDEFLLLIFKLF